MFWILPSVAASFGSALWGLINQHYRMSGKELVVWRGLVPIVLFLPICGVFLAPTDPLFYVYAVASGALAFFSDAWFLEATARYGAGLPLRLNPAAIFILFFFWLLLDPVQAKLMLDHPYEASGIVASMVVGGAALSCMARCQVTFEAMKFYMPRLFMMVLIDIFNKKAMDCSGQGMGPFYYTLVQGAAVFAVAIPFNAKTYLTRGPAAMIKAGWKPGVSIGVICVVLTLLKNLAMSTTPNPAYVSSLIMISPLWVSLYMKTQGRAEVGRFRPWLLFLASAIVMLLLVKRLQSGV